MSERRSHWDDDLIDAVQKEVVRGSNGFELWNVNRVIAAVEDWQSRNGIVFTVRGVNVNPVTVSTESLGEYPRATLTWSSGTETITHAVIYDASAPADYPEDPWEAIDRVRDRHVRHSTDWGDTCRECQHEWPCPTRRIVDGDGDE